MTRDIWDAISLVLCFEIGQERWGRKPGKTQIIWNFFALFAWKSWSSAVQFAVVLLPLESCIKSKSLAQGKQFMAGPSLSWGICSLGVLGVMELSQRGENWSSRRQLSDGLTCGSRVPLCWRITESLNLFPGQKWYTSAIFKLPILFLRGGIFKE